MKRKLLSIFAILLTIFPVCIVLLWHIHNHGLPNDDAAQYMATAYQQYSVFKSGSFSDGLQALYQIRGWRPTLFPLLATPFLCFFGGNVIAAAGVALILCFLMCQLYFYAIARHYLDSLRAALVAAFVGSCPLMLYYSTVFFSEIAWLAFFAGFVFHYLKSDNFYRPFHAAIAGIMLGLATLVRPAETFIMTILPLAAIITSALTKKAFSLKSALRVVFFLILTVFLLAVSAFIDRLDGRLVLMIGLTIVLLELIITINKEQEPGFSGFNIFAFFLVMLNLLWWADDMPAVFAWIYNASFGPIAQATDVSIHGEGVWPFFKQIFSLYLFPQLILVGVICFAFFKKDAKRDSNHLKRLYLLAVITMGLLLPMFFMYAFTGTSDLRRIFIGMSFLSLLLAIFSLQDGFIRKTRDFGIALIVTLQIAGFFFVAQGKSLSFGHPLIVEYAADIMPKSGADLNEATVLRLREAGVPEKSSIGVYTKALFQSGDRVYEPSALQLAALTTGSGYRTIYYWDIGDYPAVIKRLQENSVRFLLIDTYEGTDNRNKYQPSVQFTAALLAKIKSSVSEPPELRRIATFNLGGREHMLFAIQERNL